MSRSYSCSPVSSRRTSGWPGGPRWKAKSTPGEEALSSEGPPRRFADLRAGVLPQQRRQQEVRIKDAHANSSLTTICLEKMNRQGGVLQHVEWRDDEEHIGVEKYLGQTSNSGYRGHSLLALPLISNLHANARLRGPMGCFPPNMAAKLAN